MRTRVRFDVPPRIRERVSSLGTRKVSVARLASDPESPRYKAQVVKVAPDFL